MKMWNSIFAGAALAGMTIGSGLSHGASFTPLGDLDGGSVFSQPRGVSNDGTVVVGLSSGSSGTEAFRWTTSTGMVGLGDFPEGSANSQARGVSADGSVVIGTGNKTDFVNEAFRWTESSGLVGLGDLPGGTTGSEGWSVSADGTVVVGQSVATGPNIHAFRWTQASNTMTDLSTLFGGSFGSWANKVSGDGLVVVGGSNSSPGNQAFRWTQGGGMVGLGDLTGGDYSSEAFGVSFDGSVVVGQSSSGSGETQAFRWTQADGMVGLGDLPGGLVSSSAKGISADGSIIIGFGTPTNFARAFIWDASHQMRNLQDVLVNDYGLGASLTGWTLHEASAISADGNFIVGYATNPDGAIEGWLVSLAPSSPTLGGDYNGNGIVDAADYTVWRDHLGQSVTLFNDTTPGSVTQADYNVWKSNFDNHAGSGSGANAAVPEPTTLLMLLAGTLAICSRRCQMGRNLINV